MIYNYKAVEKSWKEGTESHRRRLSPPENFVPVHRIPLPPTTTHKT